jgi:branched-chain amino acid transport system permease protein
MGAYASAIVQVQFGIPFWAAWIFAILVTMLIAWIISLPLLRMSGHFLALGTLALGLIVETLLVQFVDITGGQSGILLPRATLVAPLNSVFPFVIVTGFLLAYWLVRNLTERSLGRSFLALRDDPAGAAALGIPVAGYKSLVFAIGGGLAALAGILYSHQFQVITPEVFGFHTSLEVLIVVVIGGMSSRYGAVLGALVVTLLPEWLNFLPIAEVENLAYGVLVLVCLLFLPGGFVGGIQSLSRSVRKAIGGKGEVSK